MSRRPANFVQADVARALRAAKASGDEWRIEIRPGGIISILPLAVAIPTAVEPLDSSDDGSTIVL